MGMKEQLTRDLLVAINDAPVLATFDSSEVTGTTGSIVTTKPLNEGGFLTEPDLSFVTTLLKDDLSTSRFETEPEPGDTITMEAGLFRIERVSKDEFGSAIQLDLMTAHK